MSIESVMPSTHLVLCHPLLVLPSIFPSISILLTCMEKSLTIYLCCTIYILTFQRNTVEFHIEHKELALLHLKYKSFIELPRVTQFFNLGVGWGWGFWGPVRSKPSPAPILIFNHQGLPQETRRYILWVCLQLPPIKLRPWGSRRFPSASWVKPRGQDLWDILFPYVSRDL